VYTPTGGVLRASNFPLLQYMVFAYKLADYQQQSLEQSAPAWVLTELFSIEARTDRHGATKDDLREMMQALLADRFHLKLHEASRPARVYALVPLRAGALGPKLQAHAGACGGATHTTNADGKPVERPLQAVKGGFPSGCGGIVGLPASAQDRFSFGAADVSMATIARSLSSWGNLGRPVVDATGMAGNYDFVLDYTPDPRPAYAEEDSAGPTFQEALQKQLGLKLESRTAPVTFLILDRVERPDSD
jgi:uncharacterized protein (TIGR03435 family)